MFTLAPWIDLTAVMGIVLALAVFLYVVLDGFDLGVGILFPLAPSGECRQKMINSIAPFWDGNETWLILAGGGLLIAFPKAYSIIMPAIYLPIMLMLLALIFRGVSFEFRFKTKGRTQKFWDMMFHFGSLAAAFFQGVILGHFIQGIDIDEGHLQASFSWFNGFTMMCGMSLVSGYALLGATWVIMKTEGETQAWAWSTAAYGMIYFVLFMLMLVIWVPGFDHKMRAKWFSYPYTYILQTLVLAIVMSMVYLLRALLAKSKDSRPFMLTILVFTLAYIALGVALWPWVIPYDMTLYDAKATDATLSLLLVAIAITLPIVLAYTALNYYIFRGKVGHEKYYE